MFQCVGYVNASKDRFKRNIATHEDRNSPLGILFIYLHCCTSLKGNIIFYITGGRYLTLSVFDITKPAC